GGDVQSLQGDGFELREKVARVSGRPCSRFENRTNWHKYTASEKMPVERRFGSRPRREQCRGAGENALFTWRSAARPNSGQSGLRRGAGGGRGTGIQHSPRKAA